MTLFREEAIAAALASETGGVPLRLITRATTRATSFVLLISAALFAAAGFLQLPRSSAASGRIVPAAGTGEVVAARDGRVVEVLVTEGLHVTRDQRLAKIETALASGLSDTEPQITSSQNSRVASYEEELVRLENESRTRARDLTDRIGQSVKSLHRARSTAVLYSNAKEMARVQSDRIRDLARAGYVSEAQVEDKRRDMIQADIAYAEAEQRADDLESEIKRLSDEKASVLDEIAARAGDIRRALAQLREQIALDASNRFSWVQAPFEGRFTAPMMTLGMPVRAGQSLGFVLPHKAHLEAEVWLEITGAGFVKAGQEVQLRLAAYPHERFGLQKGTVKNVARTVAISPTGQQGIPVRIELNSQEIVGPDRVARPLIAGSPLEAQIVLERRPMLYWLFEPVIKAWN